jgi:hypothetical protein
VADRANKSALQKSRWRKAGIIFEGYRIVVYTAL